MSKCISVHGEYSEHEYTSKPICDYCGQISEMLAIVQNEDFGTALEQIQELHKVYYRTPADEVYELNPVCDNCGTSYPCPTRKLADVALGEVQ